MNKYFLIIPLIIFFGYCTSKDNLLLETTFKREFDKSIITDYLSSPDENKVAAALLSISHSEDTSFIPQIINLDFSKNARLICFAIGQLGECFQSTKFLWERLNSDVGKENSRYIFEAIGKTGTANDLMNLQNNYANFDGLIYPYEGVSLLLQQIAQRGYEIEDYKWMLTDEVTNPVSNIQRKKDALFTLARNGSSDSINDELIKILSMAEDSNDDIISLKQFAFMNFKTQKYFPASNQNELVKKYISSPSVLLRIEAAKTICYSNFDAGLLNLYWSFIAADINPNVNTQAAISLKDIKNWKDVSIKTELKSLIENEFKSEKLSANSLGELIISYKTIFPNVSVSADMFKKIPTEYYYRYLELLPDKDEGFNLLISEYHKTDHLRNKMNCLSSILSFDINYQSHQKFVSVLLDALNSISSSLITISADAIDSVLIDQHQDTLKSIISSHLGKFKNDPEFSEAVIALFNLAEKVNSDFYQKMLTDNSDSKVYSVKKYLAENLPGKLVPERDLSEYENIIEYVYKYKQAEIVTDKGNFTIIFNPEYAPISVGNFCKLAENNFYDGIVYHRVVPGFVIQTGDPTGTGWGGPGYEIISEFSPTNYVIGKVGMASAGKDTESSQWFVMQGNYPHLNGRYSIFAEVAEGIDIIYKIERSDKILDVILIR